MDLKEYFNSVEAEYDINNVSSNPELDEDMSLNDNSEEWEIEKDIFKDENIEETLRKYNYDYKTLMREMTTFIDYSELLEILNECNIKKEDYLNPTYVTFEKIRKKILNKNKESV